MGEVGHIIRGKGLTVQMCVHVAQTAQTIRGDAGAPFATHLPMLLDAARSRKIGFGLDELSRAALVLERLFTRPEGVVAAALARAEATFAVLFEKAGLETPLALLRSAGEQASLGF